MGQTRNLILKSNTARCGSTLITQILESSQECMILSKPDAIKYPRRYTNMVKDKAFDSVVQSIINILFKTTQAAK